MKKVLKLIDKRPVSGEATRALRRVLREIENGYVTGVSIAAVRRDSSVYTFTKCECSVRQLGALDILKYDIRHSNL